MDLRAGKILGKQKSAAYFFDQLLQFEAIKNNFDIATFEYFTKLSSLFADVNSNIGRLSSLFKAIRPKSKKISVSKKSQNYYGAGI